MAKVLFSAMRNEAPFLLEWISYHKAIGFEKIIIVTNDVTDQTDELLEKLASEEQVIHLKQSVPNDESPQQSAVALVNNLHPLEIGDWGIFLDSDEFLNIKVGSGKVDDLIWHLEAKNCIGMIINWRVFGDSGHQFFAGRYVSDQFQGCDSGPPITQFKTFFKKTEDVYGFSPSIHLCDLAPGKCNVGQFLSPDGLDLKSSKLLAKKARVNAWLAKGMNYLGESLGTKQVYEIAQINHYMVRDPHSFKLKRERGRGYNNNKVNRRHTEDFYEKWNLNEGSDGSILRWEGATTNTMKNLTKICQLEGLNEEIKIDYLSGLSAQEASTSNVFAMTFLESEERYVKDQYTQSASILEYGSGGSTVFATQLGKPVISVESDKDWAASLATELSKIEQRNPVTEVFWVNVGPTKEWGYPALPKFFRNFCQYPLKVWNERTEFSPETVLIDGRMRMACFLTALVMTKKDITILFDGYTNRKKYHQIEKILKPTKTIGRLAVFEAKPDVVKMSDFGSFMPWFSDLD
jgi:hypothetical protein